MMDLTQKLIQNAAQDVFGTQVVSLDGGEQNDLSGEWARVSMFE